MGEKMKIEKWTVLNEIETNEGVEITDESGETKIVFGKDKDEIYYLVDSDFVSAYIDNKPNRMFIDKIYLNLGQGNNKIIEII